MCKASEQETVSQLGKRAHNVKSEDLGRSSEQYLGLTASALLVIQSTTIFQVQATPKNPSVAAITSLPSLESLSASTVIVLGIPQNTHVGTCQWSHGAA